MNYKSEACSTGVKDVATEMCALRTQSGGFRAHLRGLMGSFCISTDGDAEIEGAPASPLDVVCVDANKDYIIVTWKQPAVDGGSPILGYFIDK